MPSTAAAMGEVPAWLAIQRSPMMANAQVTPERSASTFPRNGSGEVRPAVPVPRKTRRSPTATGSMIQRSLRLARSRSSHGPARST